MHLNHFKSTSSPTLLSSSNSFSNASSTLNDFEKGSIAKSTTFDLDAQVITCPSLPTPATRAQHRLYAFIPTFLLNRFAARSAKSNLSENRTEEIEARVSQALSALSRAAPDNALFTLSSRVSGLYEDEVLKKRLQFGENSLSSATPPSNLRLMGRAIANPFNALLILLAVVSIATGDHFTFSFMLLMVAVGTILRFWQERQSVRKATLLSDRLTSNVIVLRHAGTSTARTGTSSEQSVQRSQLVPGDILVLTSGSLIPADCILLSSSSLSISQSMLTGEVMPVDKETEDSVEWEREAKEEGGVIHRRNVLLAGTSVSAGEGRAVVVQTGDNTYVGALACMLGGKRTLNAFDIEIRRVAYLLMGFMGVMVPVVLVVQGLTNKDAGWNAAFVFSISVAVGLIPELLPVIVNANLARGALLLGKKNVIVKRLDAVQNLGALTCICSDKTGTLTIDDVELYSSIDGFNVPSSLPLRLAFVNSSLQTGTRSLLDKAIVTAPACQMFNHQNQLNELIKLGEVPFDSTRRLLSIYVAQEGSENATIIMKGAVDEVLNRCSHYSFDAPTSPASLLEIDSSSIPLALDPTALAKIHSTADLLNNDGLRLVAVARKLVLSYEEKPIGFRRDQEQNLVFVGFLAFLDPPKEDAEGAIRELAALGVSVKILTGDAPKIAVKVARDIGLLPAADSKAVSTTGTVADLDVITGTQLAILSTGERSDFVAAVKRATIFAKVSPYQKLEIVEALRECGETVGMIGDGVNDALALRGADVGISVDTGMEIAKDASDIILLEKSLATIVGGVRLGRTTALNTIKYIKITASSNFGNVFSILAASAWLPYQPMLPTQILVQNMLYDFSQTTIPFDNVDSDYIENAPVAWNIYSVARFMIIFGPTSSIFDIVTFSINWWYYGIQTADSPLVSMAQTAWFTEGFTTQILVVYFLRTGKIPFFQSSPSLPLLCSTLFFLTLAFVLPYIPRISDALGFVGLDPHFYAFLCCIVLTYCGLVQGVKMVYQKIWKEWL